jgi:7,8-dihydropterin-6-yl-methyl-4-(beta-D-ribofuranosyl)aminobenzene 5'-phosphate synthase
MQGSEKGGRIVIKGGKMKITLIYDNEVFREELEADWGFSCLVEVEDTPRILFDTGTSGSILLSNLRKLDINPSSISEVFISHAHGDHIGGLSNFLKANSNVKLYVPSSCPKPAGVTTVSIKEPCEIHDNMFSTGELRGIEQSLVVKVEKGLVVIAGCSHPGVRNILQAASKWGKVYALVGGLHGFREFEVLKDLDLICPCHCTQFSSEIRSLYPEKCVRGGVGQVIVIKE